MSGALQAVFMNQRSFGSPIDAQFNYVTMLLHGDGTNGAQNNTFLDSSTNAFTITRNGNTTQGSFSPYGSNWSNYFDGNGDSLTAPSGACISGTGDFTAECWIFPTVVPGTYNVIGCSTVNSGLTMFGLNANGTIFYGRSLVDVQGTTTNSVTYNNWNHIAISRSSGTLKMFVNGVQGYSATETTNYVSGSVRIGTDGNGSSLPYTGYISNFRIIQGTALYTSNFTPSTTPLTAVSGTSLLTCQSNRFRDASTNNFTISVFNDTSVQRFNPFGTATAYSTSVIGGSGYFDGSGDYLNTASSISLSSSLTVECWFNLTSAQSSYKMFAGEDLSGGSGKYITLTSTGIEVQFGATGATVSSITYTFTVGVWYHFALVRNGTTVSIYINGVAQSVTNSTQSGTMVLQYVGVGYNSAYVFTGYITDFRINTTAVYTTSFTPNTTPLSAITGTSLLLNYTNGAIFDNAMMNDLETIGNAQISTSVVKYGTGSMYFDGTGDGLFARSTPDSAFGTGDLTVEFWLYLASTLNTFAKVVMMGTTGNCFTIEAQGTANFLNLTNKTSTVYVTSNTALTTGTWIHVAATRASGTLRLFQNGTQVGSAANTVDFPNAGGIYIGRSDSGQEMNGYIDDLRITKGYARYTTTFTPPTAAFPDIGPT